MAATLRAIQYGVRVPDGIFCAYTPVLVRFLPSPSRLLAIADPLLPVGILSRCLLAYAGIDEAQYLKVGACDSVHDPSHFLHFICVAGSSSR